jgi:hypothetical protein
LTEFTPRPLAEGELAQLLAQPRSATVVVIGAGSVGVGKTAMALEYARASQDSTDVRSLRRNIAEMDSLFDQLSNQATQGTIELALPILIGQNSSLNLPSSSERLTSPAAPHELSVQRDQIEPPATCVAPLVAAAVRPWSFAIGLSSASAITLFSGQTNPLEPGRRTQHDAGGSTVFAAKLHVDHSSSIINKSALLRLIQELLNFFNRIRIILRCRLVRVLSGFSRISAAINFVLLLLAAARHYGRRSEPSDHTLPVLTSMSVVIGGAARL